MVERISASEAFKECAATLLGQFSPFVEKAVRDIKEVETRVRNIHDKALSYLRQNRGNQRGMSP
jgi:hypothetical protein